MKQIIIIVGGLLSLTMMLAMFIAILLVSIFNNETSEVWNFQTDNIQTRIQSSTSILEDNAQENSISEYPQLLTQSERCQILMAKLNYIENSLANKKLSLSVSALDKIYAIKNALLHSTSSINSASCEQAISVIDSVYQ